MKSLFSPDGALFRIVDRLINLSLLNMLYLLFCIPIFTIGPATVALHYVTLKYAENEEDRVWAPFIHSFKQNFKQGIILGIITTGIGVFLAWDVWLIWPNTSPDQPIYVALFIVLVLVGIIYLMMTAYVYPMMARYDNSLTQMIRTATILAIRHLPATVCLAIMSAVPIVLLFYKTSAAVLTLMLLCVIGFAGIAFLHDQLIYRIFMQYTPKENSESE